MIKKFVYFLSLCAGGIGLFNFLLSGAVKSVSGSFFVIPESWGTTPMMHLLAAIVFFGIAVVLLVVAEVVQYMYDQEMTISARMEDLDIKK